MVNMLLLALAALTLVIWLCQELVARRRIQHSLMERIDNGSLQVAGDEVREQLSPDWSEWAFRLLLALWGAWLVSVLLVKDGDFAFVLVILTLLAAVIGGLDKYFFEQRRGRFADSSTVSELLTGFAAWQRDKLREILREQMVVAEYARSFFPVLFAVLILRSFVVEPFQIPSSSMVPTLEVGDYILVNKFSYGLRLPVIGTEIVELGEPERGDVMVFFPPDDNRYFIKRVVGLPGDEIRYVDKQLYINGKKADQSLVAQLPPHRPAEKLLLENLRQTEHLVRVDLRAPPRDFFLTVKPGHYFMMGDNRDNSRDSRFFGQVPERNIVGKAFAVWMHWPSITQLPRFDRVGTIQ